MLGGQKWQTSWPVGQSADKLKSELTKGSEASSEIQYRVDRLNGWPVGQRGPEGRGATASRPFATQGTMRWAKLSDSIKTVRLRTRRSRAPTHCIPCQHAHGSTSQLTLRLTSALRRNARDTIRKRRGCPQSEKSKATNRARGCRRRPLIYAGCHQASRGRIRCGR